MHAFLISAAALATAAFLGAQNPDGSPPKSAYSNEAQSQSQVAWNALKKQHPAWTADWTLATRTPNAVITDGLEVSPEPILTIQQARPHAEAVLARYADLLGRGESTFVETIAQKVGQLHILVYDQYYRGLEVIGGRADVRIHEIGRVPMFGAIAVPIPANFATIPALGGDQAIATAHRAAGVAPRAGILQNAPLARLVVWADVHLQQMTPVHLAWEVRIGTADDEKYGRSYVDAMNGNVLRYETDRHECSFGCTHSSHEGVRTETGSDTGLRYKVEYGEPSASLVNVTGTIRAYVTSGLDNREASYAVAPVLMEGVRVTITSTAAFDLTDNSGAFNIAHGGTAGVTLNISFANGLRLSDVTVAQGTKLNVLVPATPGVPLNLTFYSVATATEFNRAQTNAFYLTTEVNNYCRTIIGALPAATDAIRANVNVASSCNASYGGNVMNFYNATASCANTSYTTVVQHEWGHGLDDRYGGISQTDGLSEGWGDIIAMYHTGQPVIGPNFNNSGTPVRTGLNTLTYPAGGGVHTQGQTWMGFGWDVRVGLINKLGAGPGVARAEQIVLASIVADAVDQPAAVRQVYLLDDNDGNLANGTPNCDVLEAARIRRTLPQVVGLVCGAVVSPIAYASAEGEVSNTFPFGSSATHSYMQSHADMRGRPLTIVGISWRRDGVLASNPAYLAKTVTANLYLGGGNHLTFDDTFAANYTTARTLVASGTFNMPSYVNPPVAPPAPFSFRIPTNPYAWNGLNDLNWEARVTAMSLSHAMYSDAVNASDQGAANDTSYGTGCLSTGQGSLFSLNSVFTTSRVSDRHAFTWNAQFARASSPAVLNIGTAQTNLAIPGLCTGLYTPPVIILSTASNAAGTITIGPLNAPFNVGWIGAVIYSQAACIDAGQPGLYKVSLSDGSRGVVPSIGGPRVSRLYATGNSAALTGTVAHSYGLVVRFD